MTTDYLSNALNQYEYLGTDADKPSAQNLAHDADGNLVEAFIVADMNCDGALDSYDIDPFVLALTNPTLYEQTYPNCNILNGDLNGDGEVNSFDLDLFTALLPSKRAQEHSHGWSPGARRDATRGEKAISLPSRT